MIATIGLQPSSNDSFNKKSFSWVRFPIILLENTGEFWVTWDQKLDFCDRM